MGMQVHFLDPFRPGSSVVHRLDARIKLVLALAFILTVSLVPSGIWPVYVLLFSLVLSVEIASELGVGTVLRRAVLAFPFVLAALPLVFSTGGEVLGTIPVGIGTLTIFEPGVERFLSIALKSWISVQMAILLAATTPFPDLLMAMRAIRIPRLLVGTFSLMWRYLFVLVDEAQRLMRARESRSGQAERQGAKTGGTVAWRARVTGGMAGNLFLRSFERGDRIYSAMAARGYDGEIRTLPVPRVPTAQWVVLALGLLLLVALLGLSFLFSL
jgi:cobalt/nickel transport system permease protein